MDPEERTIRFALGTDSQLPADVLIARLRQSRAASRRPLIVGVDGRSGAGKSTLAAAVSAGFAEAPDGAGGVTVIEGDDFYTGGSAAAWDRRTAAEKADRVIDWRRQHDVLQRLRRHGVAEWRPFDWDSDDWDADMVSLAPVATVARTAPVTILEGAYSCRPELHDLLDLRVLLDTPRGTRRRQLLEREGSAHERDWDARWQEAENHYFGMVMPPERFDLVLSAR